MMKTDKKRSSRRLGWVLLFLSLSLVEMLSLSGCTRRFFRRRADAAVDEIMCEKDHYAQWKLNDYYVYPHPLSRFADPTDPDRPPMPPDDPAAWDLSPHPQRPLLKGYAYWQGTGYLELMRRWDEENRTKAEPLKEASQEQELKDEEVEAKLMGEDKTLSQRARETDLNIDQELAQPIVNNEQLPVSLAVPNATSAKPFRLNLEQITELGFLNSREFQTIREQLYLTALAVTAERFAFIAQPFATEQLIRQRSGRQVGNANNWISTGNAGFTKAFSTGALLLFNFANQTVYNLGRSGPTTSVSTINLDIVQPFLAGGGRAVALEPLTQAERDLVYAIRQFFRFRQEYYVFFAAGQSTAFIPGVGAGVVALLPSTVAQPGAFVPGPFTLPIVNNPANVQVSPTTPLGPILNSGVLITPQGYLSAIQERTVLFNYYKNIQALQRYLNIFDRWLEGGLINNVQHGLVEARLLASYEAVLGFQLNFRVSLDQLKQQLGLPLTVPLDIEPGPLQPMINIIGAYEKLFIDHERVITNIDQMGRKNEAQLLRKRLRRLLDLTQLMRGTQARERILARLPYWENFAKDKPFNEREKALMDERSKLNAAFNALRAEQRKRAGETKSEDEERRITDILFERNLLDYELGLLIYEQEQWRDEKDPEDEVRKLHNQFFGVRRIFLNLADYAYTETLVKTKSMWPELPRIRAKGVDVIAAPEDEALLAVEQATFESRVDLMNVRAQVTDAWRKIRVAANALMGTFNVDYHLGSTTPAGAATPFAFSGARTTHELIFTGQLPLVRILQRNNYRSTLINFQQNRRSLMAFEDQLLFNVRYDLRQVRVLANNYQRVQKRQIELAYMQVDQALQAFSQPQAPPGADNILPGLIGPVSARPQPGDPAALTAQLLSTQASLLSSQNDLYNTWIVFTINRTYLYRDMGVMPLDNRGVWIDADATANNTSDNCQPGGQQQQAAGAAEQPPAPRPEQLPQPRPESSTEGAALEPAR